MKSIALCATFVACFLAACGGDDGNAPHPGTVDTTIDDGPAALTNQGAAMFVFHATPVGDAGAFQCAVDGGAPAACSSPFAVTVGAGDHTFSVAALDAAGDPDATPATRTWKVDTTPPETTITAQPGAIDDSPAPAFAFAGTDDSGSTLTFECATDGAAFAACTSPTTLAALADGPHAFAVRAIDGAGNPDPSPATASWTIDTTSPDTTITGGPDEAGVSNALPTFTFTSSLATATFQCAIDPPTGAFATCSSPFTPSPALAGGAHTFAVRAEDANGVFDPTPAMRGWTVDTDPPDVAITATPTNPSNVGMPVFSFSSTDASATFQCALGAAGTFTACASPYTVPSIGDGANLFKVRAVDAVGNRTPSPATYSWQVDTIAPTLTITSQPAAASNDATPTVTFTFLGGPVTITCVVDGAAAIPCDSPFTSAALGEGSHAISVTITDNAGNATTKTTSTFGIDLTPPTVMISSGPPNPTKLKTPQFMFAAPGAAKLECSIDGAAFAICTSPLTTGALADGSHTFTVRGTDAVGNAATASSTFVVDTAPPTLSITSSPPNPTNATTAVVAFTVGSGPATTTCQVDALAPAACTTPFTSGTLLEGAHTITVVATDTAGNTATAAKTFAIDLTAPMVVIDSSPTSPTNTKVATVTFTVTGGATSTQCSLDGAAFAPCSTSVTTPALTDGSHTFTVKATDAAGNAGQAMATWVVQTGAPVVTIMSAPSGTIGVKTASVVFTVAGTMVQTIQCQLDTAAFATCTSPYMVSGLADGTHTITIKATDAASNAGTAFATFTVDTTAPSVVFDAQPAPHTNVVPPSVTFTISGGAVSTKCDVDGGGFADCTSPFAAAGLADGDHAISVRATDFVGNANTKVATFNLDTVTPTATITAGPGPLTNQTKPPITFTTTDAPTTIQCQVDALGFAACTSPFAPTTALGDGSHTIAIKVADLAGNTSTTSTTFTVDATPPGIVIDTKPPANWNSTTATITFTATGAATVDCALDGGTFGACTTASSYTVTALSEMAHTLTVRATDAAGNPAQASAAFTVDVTPPTVHITTTFTAPVASLRPAIAYNTSGQSATDCQIDTGGFVACTTTGFTPTGDLTQGDHTYTVRVTDLAGNQASDSVTFTVDTVAPVVAIDPAQPTLTNNALQPVNFTVTGSPTKIECQLETTGGFAACTSPFTPTMPLGEGAHTVTVKGTDAAGNHAQAAITFTVDTVAPTLTFMAQPPAQTKTNTTTLTWTVSGQQSVACTLDGVGVTCTTSYATGALADGMHTFIVKATDAATNATTITAMWTIDTTGPAFTLMTQPSTPTNDTMPEVTFDVAADATTVECALDGAFAACPLPLGTYSATVGAGTHTMAVREGDALGNKTTHATASFVVDLTPPTVTITGPANGAPTSSPTFALSANEAGSTFQCNLDSTTYAACTTPVSPAFVGSTNPHTLAVEATDPAGNVSLPQTVAVTLDPVVECLAGANAGTGSLAGTSTATLAQATIEFWYRASAATTQDLLTFDVPAGTGFPTMSPAVDVSIVASKIVVTVKGAGGTVADQSRYTPAGSLAAWHHYAVELTGTATRVFVDGTELTATLLAGAATATFASAFTGEAAAISLHVGGAAFGGEAGADGGMLGLRVSSAVVYTAAFTPPAYPFVAPAPAGAVVQFGLDDGTGTSSADEHATPAATVTWPVANWTASCF